MILILKNNYVSFLDINKFLPSFESVNKELDSSKSNLYKTSQNSGYLFISYGLELSQISNYLSDPVDIILY